MHLIRMLRVSDTFTAGEIPMGRYHVVGAKSLPRFNRGQPAVREAIRPGGGPCPVWEQDSELSQVPAPVAEAQPVTGGSVADPCDAKEQENGGEPGSASGASSSQEGWILRLVRWLGDRLMRRRNPFVNAGPRVARTVVPQQGCLKLDGVRVVRNDLSDTDFEVVPARRARQLQRERPASLACTFREETPESVESAELRVSNL